MEIDRIERHEYPLTLLLLDIDDFKNFQRYLRSSRGRSGFSATRPGYKKMSAQGRFGLFGYGGEEFTIILPMTTKEEGYVTAERIRAELKKEIFLRCGINRSTLPSA